MHETIAASSQQQTVHFFLRRFHPSPSHISLFLSPSLRFRQRRRFLPFCFNLCVRLCLCQIPSCGLLQLSPRASFGLIFQAFSLTSFLHNFPLCGRLRNTRSICVGVVHLSHFRLFLSLSFLNCFFCLFVCFLCFFSTQPLHISNWFTGPVASASTCLPFFLVVCVNLFPTITVFFFSISFCVCLLVKEKKNDAQV